MDGLSQLHAQQRAPRVHLPDFTPAVLRFQNGERAAGKVQVLSLTGGLLSLTSPIHQGSQVKMLFLTRTGPVLGAAEMLSPVTSTEQPFRFLSIPVDDRRRLGAAIQSFMNQKITRQNTVEEQWMEKLRAASLEESKPRPRLLKFLLGAAVFGILGLGCFVYLLQTNIIK